MQKLLRVVLYLFLIIFALTALTSLVGLIYLWWGYQDSGHFKDLPYLGWLLGATVAEAAGTVVLFAQKGMKYLPEVKVHETEDEILDFMKSFISLGSSVTIVSNRVAWLRRSSQVKDAIVEMTSNGKSLEIITPVEVGADIREPLEKVGAKFYVTHEDRPPEARFTLVDGDRSGAERLAIARGGYPDHEITIFDNNSGPQMIAMAKDIIRKCKELANA